MAKIDVIKEKLQFHQLLKENNTTTILKEEYLIPDTHPDVQQILDVEARPRINTKEIVGNKVVLDGKVDYIVLYVPREDSMSINSVSYSEKFTSSLDLVEGEHKVVCEVECKVEHIDANIMNERKIAIEGVINFNWELYKDSEIDFVRDVQASSGVEILKKTESINRMVANKECELVGKSVIRIGMDKPQIVKVLNCDLSLHKKEVKLSEDKVYIACYCKVNLLYCGDESKEIINIEDDVYLSKEEEMPGIFPDMTPVVTYKIKNSDISIEDDDLGESRIINIEFLVKNMIKVFSNEDIDVIKDAYSPKFGMSLVKDTYEVGVMKGTQNFESIVKDNIYLKEGDMKPDKIIAAFGNAMITDKSIKDDKIAVEGVIKANIVYKGMEEEGFSNISADIPFDIVFDIPNIENGMKVIVACDLEGLDTSREANTIAVKANLFIYAKTFAEVKKEFISDVIEGEEEEKEKNASVTIYVISKGDTLWNLAKKYNTTVNELMSMNDIEDADYIEEGARLIIPGRAIF